MYEDQLRSIAGSVRKIAKNGVLPEPEIKLLTGLLRSLLMLGKWPDAALLAVKETRVEWGEQEPELVLLEQKVELFASWLAGVRVLDPGESLRAAFAQAKRGETLVLPAGIYAHADLLRADDSGEGRTAVMAWPAQAAYLQMNPVGGSDTIHIKSSHVELDGLRIQCDDRAGIKFSSQFPVEDVELRNLLIEGGYTSGREWGIHGYSTADLTIRDTEVRDLLGPQSEHAAYLHLHGKTSRHLFERFKARRTGRTAVQIVAREGEGPRPLPGSIDLFYCEAHDTCLEGGGGGSAFTFRGGMAQHRVRLVGCVARLGCDPTLDPMLGRNITGALVNDAVQGLSWDDAGVENLELIGCDFEVGSVYPGDRPLAMISHVSGELNLADCRMVVHPGSQPIALKLDRDTIGQIRVQPMRKMEGRVFWGGATYASWDDFLVGTADDPKVIRP